MTDISKRSASEQLAELEKDPQYKELIDLFLSDTELVNQLGAPETSLTLLLTSIGWSVECAIQVYGFDADIAFYTQKLIEDEELTYHSFSEFFQGELKTITKTIIALAVDFALRSIKAKMANS